MRALRTCEFCEATAVGTFELLPPELEPTEAEQRRVVLCSDCKDHLEHLLEPLLTRARANGTTRSDEDTASTTDHTETTPAQTASAETLESDDTITFTADGDATTDNTAVDAAADDTSTTSGSVSSFDAVEAPAEETPDSDNTADEDSSSNETADEARTDTSTTADTDAERDADTPTETETATKADARTNTDTDKTRPPQTYGKVIRLLRNRDFPMERTAVEALASGAYDLESDEIAAILDHAIENGEFLEEDGTLRRP